MERGLVLMNDQSIRDGSLQVLRRIVFCDVKSEGELFLKASHFIENTVLKLNKNFKPKSFKAGIEERFDMDILVFHVVCMYNPLNYQKQFHDWLVITFKDMKSVAFLV